MSVALLVPGPVMTLIQRSVQHNVSQVLLFTVTPQHFVVICWYMLYVHTGCFCPSRMVELNDGCVEPQLCPGVCDLPPVTGPCE